MGRSWSFGHKLGAGLALLIALTVVTGAVSIFALRDVVQAKDRVITVNAQNLIDAERLRGAFNSKVAVFRGYILLGHEDDLGRIRESRQRFAGSVAALRKHASREDDRQALLTMEQAEAEHEAAVQRAIAARKAGADLAGISRQLDVEAMPLVDRLLRAIDGLIHREELALSERQREASQSASFADLSVLLRLCQLREKEGPIREALGWYAHIIVDEGQDLSLLELEAVLAATDKRNSITLSADSRRCNAASRADSHMDRAKQVPISSQAT